MSKRLASLSSRVLFVVCLTLLLEVSAAAQVGPEVSSDTRHDLSPPLRDMIYSPATEALTSPHVVLHLPPKIQRTSSVSNLDPVLQAFPGSPNTPDPILNFPGLGRGYPGYFVNVAPPDTNAAVGQTQIVEWVNTNFVVWDKNGVEVQEPRPGNFFWTGFGGDCETHNDGDPIIKYDKAAGVWFASQPVFGPFAAPHSTCIAISQTDDATGPYYRYQFSQPRFPDYPKFGIWPDSVSNAYFGSFNQFSSPTAFAGPRVCAYDRASMLMGAPATQVCYDLPANTDDTLLPADMDSAPPPDVTRDNFLVGSLEDRGPNEFAFYAFHADFANGIFALSDPTIINVDPFTDLCNGGACVAQLGTTAKLDSLSGIFMYRNAYRWNNGTESLVVNHSINTDMGGGGIRWYEIHDPSTSPSVFQSGTYAPDPTQVRWMGSIAMDSVGDICVGYSVSSAAMHPAIRYACRQPDDPLGTLGNEVSIVEGDGSQLDTASRWGDYSSIVLDPVDDCTFLYANEYYMAPDAAFNWSTQLATFAFPGCGVPPASGTLRLRGSR